MKKGKWKIKEIRTPGAINIGVYLNGPFKGTFTKMDNKKPCQYISEWVEFKTPKMGEMRKGET